MPTSGPGTPDKTARTARGFTLIEVAVVMLVFVILLGMAGLRLTHDNSDLVRDEAARLVVALQGAQQQAILEGKVYALGVEQKRYQFYTQEKSKLVRVKTDESLGPHDLPPDVSLAIGEQSERATAANDKRRADLVIFEPTGEFEPFTLVLQVKELYWYVRGNADGQITSSGNRPS